MRSDQQTVVRIGAVMGTIASIHAVPGAVSGDDLERALDEAFSSLDDADAMFSLWKPESTVNQLRTGSLDLADAPGEVSAVVDLCRDARELSRGWFDPWAVDATTDRGVAFPFDPTGAVKGWAAERALGVLTSAGVTSALVNAGGDIACAGERPGGGPWRAGIRHPWRHDALACVATLPGALATSGPYEQGAHLVSPFDGSRPAAIVSASVSGPSLALADALATALAVGGRAVEESIARLDGYECYLIAYDGREHFTGGFPFAAAGRGAAA